MSELRIDNPYRVLGVSQGADLGAIQQAWRKRSRECHPDRNPDPQAVERFRAIQEAWAILSDPERRARCDEALRSVLNPDPERTLSSLIADYLEGFSHVRG